MPIRPRVIAPAFALAALLLPAPARAEEVLVIKDVRILPVSGPAIPKGTVLVRDGKIVEVGTAVAVPWAAKVVPGEGKVLIPGFVVAHTWAGTDNPNENVPITPFVSTVDSIDPVSVYFESQLRHGVTTLAVYPGDRSPIGGQGIVVKIRANTVHGMLLVRHQALKISLAAGRNRMQTMAQIRKAFEDAKEAKKKVEEAKKKAAAGAKPAEEKGKEEKKEEGKKEEAKDGAAAAAPQEVSFKIQPLLDAMDGKLPCIVTCEQPGDVLRAVALAKELGLKITLVLHESAYRAYETIAREKLPVILEAGATDREEDPESGRETIHVRPAILRKAGVEFALAAPPSRRGSGESEQQWYQGALAVKWGMSPEEALKALTLWPARVLGQEARLGSIEKGKDADLVLLSGDPFSVRTFVERVWIDGKEAYHKDRDPWLDRLYYKKK